MAVRTISDLLKTAVSKDTHRLILCGVCEDAGEDGTFRVATDTHRMVIVRVGDPAPKGKESVRVIYPEDVAFEAVNSMYPTWRKVVPTAVTRSVDLHIPSLRVAVTSAMAAGKFNANRIRLTFEGSSALISGKSEEFGSSVFSMPMQRPISLENFEIAFNGKYLLDSLPAFRNDDQAWVRFEMTESCRPAILTYPNAEGHWTNVRVVLMPMALA